MRFDLVVVGGGVVGASLARAVRGLSVALVAGARAPGTPMPAPGTVFPAGSYDARVYALSPGSVEFLRSIGVWDAIPADRLTPVHGMRVHGDAGRARIEFDAYRAGVSELAWIVEDRELQAALWRALDGQEGLDIAAPSVCESLELGGGARITLADGRVLEADLVVGADGADSFVRSAAGIGVFGAAYDQAAVVANFSCERAHGNTAVQWFQGGPVLALLPLPGDRVSMVWSTHASEAGRLMDLDAAALGREVTAASQGLLGSLALIAPPQSYPLRRLSARRLVLSHLALAGDAAHVIHPLAGQGLNLGLQDVCLLAALLVDRAPVRSAGDLRLLRRYERERSEALLAMRTTVHGLHVLFGAGSAAVRRVRNFGLNLTDGLPVLKNVLLRHALR